MLEVPVAYVIEEHGLKRKTAVFSIGGTIALASDGASPAVATGVESDRGSVTV